MEKRKDREPWVALFKYGYLILLFGSFLNLTSERMTGLAYLVTGAGLLLLLWDLCTRRCCLHTRGVLFLIGLIAVYGVSSLLHADYGIRENLKGILWMVLQFAVLFGYDAARPRAYYQRQARGLMAVFCALTFFASLAGLLMFWQDYGTAFETESGKLIIRGFMYGRLWGEYTDPNYGSVFAALSVLFSGYFAYRYRKLPLRLLLLCNAFLQLSYLALSDSRTGLVSFGIAAAVGAAGAFGHRFHGRWKSGKTAAAAGLCFLLTAAAAVGGIRGLQAGWMYAPVLFQEEAGDGESGSHRRPSLSAIEVGREDMPEDVSNQRFQIWGSGFELLQSAPLFGTSPRNMLAYAKDRLPDTYVARMDFNSFHNAFFDVLFCLGIAGILPALLFVIGQLRFLLPNLLRPGGGPDFSFLLLSSLVVLLIACSAMFLTEIVLINSVGAFFFWNFLGYLNHYFDRPPTRRGQIDQRSTSPPPL